MTPGEELAQKIEYVYNFQPDSGEEFIQHWPGPDGDFDPVVWFSEMNTVLSSGENPIVSFGVLCVPLCIKAAVRARQYRFPYVDSDYETPLSPKLKEAISSLEATLRDKYSEEIQRAFLSDFDDYEKRVG